MFLHSELILIVEDEADLREMLSYQLRSQGYSVVEAADGPAALEIARSMQPHLILLDANLPGLDGFEVCRTLRQETNTPIFFLTARAEEKDRVLGLEIGADDYILKPFHMRELLASIRALFRMVRVTQQESHKQAAGQLANAFSEETSVLEFGDLTVDPARHEVRLDGQPLSLKPKEYTLMSLLARNQGIALSADFLLEQVWKNAVDKESRTVYVHIRWLRQKIEKDATHPTRIVTVRGVGYRFDG